MTTGVTCPECGETSPADATTCVHCLSSLRRPTAAGRARTVAKAREDIVRALDRQTTPLRLARVVYALYLAAWAVLALVAFVSLTNLWFSGPFLLGIMLFFGLTLCLMVLGLRRLDGPDAGSRIEPHRPAAGPKEPSHATGDGLTWLLPVAAGSR